MNSATGEEQFGGSELERRARTLLVESTEAMPGAVRSRLTQARHAALDAHTHGARYRLQRWLPAGALAAAALAVLVVYLPHKHPAPTVAVISGSIDDIDLLTSDVPLNSDPDVDYSFYEWAVDAAGNSAGARASPAVAGSNGT